MKKVILGALLVASIATLSSFTTKSDTVKGRAVADRTVLGTADDRTVLGTADDRTVLGTADDRTVLGTADARKMKQHVADRTVLGTAD